jgi:hypothetical protein
MNRSVLNQFRIRYLACKIALASGRARRVYTGETFTGLVVDGDTAGLMSYTVHTTEAGEREIRFGDGWTVNEDGQVVT